MLPVTTQQLRLCQRHEHEAIGDVSGPASGKSMTQWRIAEQMQAFRLNAADLRSKMVARYAWLGKGGHGNKYLVSLGHVSG